MNISRNKATRKKKKCIHPWCNIMITDSVNKHQCSDPNCIKMRKNLSSIEQEFSPKFSNNLIIRNRWKKEGQVENTITIRCCAKNNEGRSCGKRFQINYLRNQKVYPKYCPEHRNEYKRERFRMSGEYV